MGGEIELRVRSQLSYADRNPVANEVLLKPKLIHSDCGEARDIANCKNVTHMLGRDVLAAEPVPLCGKASSSPSKQFLKINIPLNAHQAGINCPSAYAARRIAPNLRHILRVKRDASARNSSSKTGHIRADSDEFVLAILVAPVASLTVPVAVMMMMPIFIIPIVISTILVGKGCQ